MNRSSVATCADGHPLSLYLREALPHCDTVSKLITSGLKCIPELNIRFGV